MHAINSTFENQEVFETLVVSLQQCGCMTLACDLNSLQSIKEQVQESEAVLAGRLSVNTCPGKVARLREIKCLIQLRIDVVPILPMALNVTRSVHLRAAWLQWCCSCEGPGDVQKVRDFCDIFYWTHCLIRRG